VKKTAPEVIEPKLLPGDRFFDLIAEAYEVFDYPKPKSLEVCLTCCMNPEIAADFLKHPIDRLPRHYVHDWYNAAYEPRGIAKETWGYLLPRILEILAVGQDVSNIGKELSLNRFDTGNPEKWSKREWTIIDRF
jgi:hypothetical protein